MMKKLLLIGTLVLSMSCVIKAQTTYTQTVVDTLHYYFNKYYFKTGQTTYSNYPYYKSAACTNTGVTHVGSRFDNATNSLTITGLEAFVGMPLVTANPIINVHMYLCNINSSGLPQMPPIDSISVNVDGSYKYNPKILGGNFVNAHVVTGDYAVLLRNMSIMSGDTVYLLRTAGKTATAQANNDQHKYADGNYGFVRYLQNFMFSKNFNSGPGFGVGTDYEFMVAPRVVYDVEAKQAIPQIITDFNDGVNTDTICTRTPFTFTNQSSYQFTNRFYNLNEFYRKWNLYYAFVAQPAACGGFSADSAITWNFEYEENAFPPRDPRKFLPYVASGNNGGTVTSSTDLPGCWDNTFRARLRPMSAFGRQCQIAFNIPFKICLSYCGRDDVGIQQFDEMTGVSVYPNPLVNGQARVTGLSGSNTIKVYDVVGQLVSSQKVNESNASIDLQGMPAGTYLVRIENEQQMSKVIRLVK